MTENITASEYIKQNLNNFGEDQVIQLFYLFSKDRLRFDGKDWWIYVKYAWRMDDESIHMIWTLFKSQHFSTLIWREFSSLPGTLETKTLISKNIETIVRDVDKRKRYIYKILKSCEPLLYDSTFQAQIDTQKVVHFLNGTHDGQTFRSTVPEDKNTLTTCYFYRREGTSDTSKLLSYLSSIVGFDQISILLSTLKSILFATINNKLVMFVGGPNSGRSTFLDLICVTFGDYFQNLSCARLPDAAHIHLNNKGCRFVLIELLNDIPHIAQDKLETLITRQNIENGYTPSYTFIIDTRIHTLPNIENINVIKINFINSFEPSTFRNEWKALAFKDELIKMILEADNLN